MLVALAAVVPDVVRGCIKESFRAFGVATSHLRALPDFLLIGTHRGGTTSLHSFLTQHPCVAPTFPRVQRIKGVRYFDQHFHRGTDWYRSHFPTAATRALLEYRGGAPVLAGDSSPYYLFHPLAAERASQIVPRAQIIVLLRNPIERAYSHWRRERRDGYEPLTFEDAIDAEEGRLAGEVERIAADDRYYSYVHENFSYVSQGMYLASLEPWLDRFPRDQVLIESSEEFHRHPQHVFDRVLGFLRLPPFELQNPTFANTNPAADPVRPDTRARLQERFAPHNERLERALGMHFDWS